MKNKETDQLISCGLKLLSSLSMGMLAAGLLEKEQAFSILDDANALSVEHGEVSDKTLVNIMQWCNDYSCPYCGYSKDDRMNVLDTAVNDLRLFKMPKLDEFLGIPFDVMMKKLKHAPKKKYIMIEVDDYERNVKLCSENEVKKSGTFFLRRK
jgi:hypothetical protein